MDAVIFISFDLISRFTGNLYQKGIFESPRCFNYDKVFRGTSVTSSGFDERHIVWLLKTTVDDLGCQIKLILR
jgi:hypothetical protein